MNVIPSESVMIFVLPSLLALPAIFPPTAGVACNRIRRGGRAPGGTALNEQIAETVPSTS